MKLDYKKRRQMRKELMLWVNDLDWVYDEKFYTDSEYIACVEDIFKHPAFQSMEGFIQHGKTSTRTHCIQVSYLSYSIAKMLKLDYRSCARAGLLHDLFLYDWHTFKKEKGKLPHGYTHPKTALINARKYFSLSLKEEDIIVKHMWPLTIIPPLFAEGFVVLYADKYCALAEMLRRIKDWFQKNFHLSSHKRKNNDCF